MSARAPGRVNLIGEHLDYNGGLCLPIALPLGTTATVSAAPGRTVRITSGAATWHGDLDQRPTGWPAYVMGVLAELGVGTGLEIRCTSDLPIGAGLSSSAALECCVALAVNELLALDRSRQELADACVRAENLYVGVPTGGMDQAAALFSIDRAALLLDFSTGARSQVPFDPAGADLELLVVDTGVKHSLAGSEYAARRADCERAAKELGLSALATVHYDQLAALSNERLQRRARHVLTEQQRVLSLVTALHYEDWSEVGALMSASHLSLRDDYDVSCPELDFVVAAALGGGALGARMTGGGFGGSAIVLCRPADVAEIQARISAGFTADGAHAADAPTLYRVEASAGATLLD